MSSLSVRMSITLSVLFSAGCLGEPVDPRPLPRAALDGALFDARKPPNAPGYGSGYGSGAPAPSGPSGSSSDATAILDAGLDGTVVADDATSDMDSTEEDSADAEDP